MATQTNAAGKKAPAYNKGGAAAQQKKKPAQNPQQITINGEVQNTVLKGRNRKELGARELSDFCRQISTLINSGVTIVRALTIAYQEEGLKPKIAQIYQNILAAVRTGSSLSAAMEAQEVFPSLMIGMIQAGEGNGKLGNSFEQLANHYEKQYQLEKQVKAAMTYPVILLILAVVIVIVIFTFVLPQFEDMFNDMENIPALTEFLMSFSDFMINRWYVLLGAVFAIGLVFKALLSSPALCFYLDKAKVHMPLIGNLNKVIYTARFARSLASLYGSGMTIVAALQVARNTVGNSYISAQFDDVLAKIRGGASLSRALQDVDGFRMKLASIVQVGEETGEMETMLKSIADSMEYDAQEASKQMMAIMEPVMIVVMAIVVGGIVIAVMLPIIQSYGAIEASANV